MSNTDNKRQLLLASMRVANLNLRTWQAEIDMIGVALSTDQMSVEVACEQLDEIGVLQWLPEIHHG